MHRSDTTADAPAASAPPPDRVPAPRRRRRRPTPTRNPLYRDLPLAEVRARRHALMAEETSVSYWRRIVQTRVDLWDQEWDGEHTNQLSAALAASVGSPTRVAHLSMLSSTELAAMPDLPRIWAQFEFAGTDDELRRALTALRKAERGLSEYRADLHATIDSLTAELIARYHENPSLALAALPGHDAEPMATESGPLDGRA